MKGTICIDTKTSGLTRAVGYLIGLMFLIASAPAYASGCSGQPNCIDDSDLFPTFRFVQTHTGHVVIIAVAIAGGVVLCFAKRGGALKALANFALGSALAAALLNFLASFS